MFDLRGPDLEADERELLLHPLAGGVILFSRNFSDARQLTELCNKIHALRKPPLLIATDHEGGRVQRFREAFTTLPPCRCFGAIYDENQLRGLELAAQAGWLMASELLSVGVDFSFAPVLDLDTGISQVIGDRAFHRKPDMASILAKRFMHGMKEAGMSAVGKHFPGHGSVREDSHHSIPLDNRRYEDIVMSDLLPFERLINAGLPAIMPAHVIYPEVDDKPAGYSRRWLQDILRSRLGFHGVIFSDDISMVAAGVAGSHTERAAAALTAGCDMVLICNNQEAVIKVIDALDYDLHPALQARLMRMHGRGPDNSLQTLQQDNRWQTVAKSISALNQTPELELGDDEIKT
jgi:beta-N-acetylhexosaminidase